MNFVFFNLSQIFSANIVGLNSGYQGIWIPGGQFSLDSAYYSHMIDPRITWHNKNNAGVTNEARWQFVGTFDHGENGGFMLNTDFALFYDVQVRVIQSKIGTFIE